MAAAGRLTDRFGRRRLHQRLEAGLKPCAGSAFGVKSRQNRRTKTEIPDYRSRIIRSALLVAGSSQVTAGGVDICSVIELPVAKAAVQNTDL